MIRAIGARDRFAVQRSKKNRWLVSKKNSIASRFVRVALRAASRMSELVSIAYARVASTSPTLMPMKPTARGTAQKTRQERAPGVALDVA
jgi:hypothetical protein